MKKCVALTLVIMLVAVVAVLLTGCGNDTEQAKAYMQQGDKLVKQYEEEIAAWEQEIRSATSPSDMEKIKASANDMKFNMRKWDVFSEQTFERILSLKGVEDYAKCADLKIDALEKQKEFVTVTNAYLDQYAPMVSSGDVGVDPLSLTP